MNNSKASAPIKKKIIPRSSKEQKSNIIAFLVALNRILKRINSTKVFLKYRFCWFENLLLWLTNFFCVLCGCSMCFQVWFDFCLWLSDEEVLIDLFLLMKNESLIGMQCKRNRYELSSIFCNQDFLV